MTYHPNQSLLIATSILLVLLSIHCQAQTDSVIVKPPILELVDLDGDDVVDTLVTSVETVVKRGREVRRYRVPTSILWGDDSPATTDDRDTTLFSLPFGRAMKSTLRVFKYDDDDIPDIHVTWNSANSSRSRNQFRELVFLGGSSLRSEDTLTLGSTRATAPSTSSVRDVALDTASYQYTGTGNFYFRQRPQESTRAKRAPLASADTSATPSAAVRLVPNPATTTAAIVILNSEYHVRSVSVFDGGGRSVLDVPFADKGVMERLSLDVESLANGQYTVVVTLNSGERLTTTLIVKR